jgi:hypothetical protein
VVKIVSINHPSRPQSNPYDERYQDRYKTLPDYLKISHIAYQEPQNTNMSDTPDSIDAILNSKKDLILDKLGMLVSALNQRKKIKRDVFSDIEKDSVWCQNEIFGIEQLYDPRLEREWKQRKLDLNREYRQEKTSYFRDLTTLESELRDTMLDYIKESQLNQLLQ